MKHTWKLSISGLAKNIRACEMCDSYPPGLVSIVGIVQVLTLYLRGKFGLDQKMEVSL